MTQIKYTHHDEMDQDVLAGLQQTVKGRVCLSGPGGAGKSALMTHLCTSHRGEFEGWAYIVRDSASAGALAESLETCLFECWVERTPDHMSRSTSNAVRLRGQAHADAVKLHWSRIRAVLFLDWMWRQSVRALLVFDNAESVKSVEDLLKALPLNRGDLGQAADDTSVIEAADIASAIAHYPPFTDSGTPNQRWATELADAYVTAAQNPIFRSGLNEFRCNVVVVTNSAEGAGTWSQVTMRPFAGLIGAKIVADHAGRPELESDPDTLPLVDDVGGLPLALAQAGKTIGAGEYESVAAYRADLARALQGDTELEPIFSDVHRFIKAHPNVAATMRVAKQTLLRVLSTELHEAAQKIWRICSALPTARLPGCLFDSVCKSTDQRRAILERMVDFFWLTHDPSGNGVEPAYIMHRVHRAVLAGVPTDEKRSELNDEVVRVVSSALLNPGRLQSLQDRSDFNDLYSHAIHAVELVAATVATHGETPPLVEHMCDDSGFFDDLIMKLAVVAAGSRNDSRYDLASFVTDLRVQTWLHRGYWHALLTNQAADRLDFDDMYNLETAEGLDRLKRACASLWRAEHGAAMVAATCMFFATHFWWAEYIPEDHICRPLLDELRESVEATPEDNNRGERVELVEALRTIYDRYPSSYWYEERTTARKNDWVAVEASLRTVRRLLALEADTPSGAPAMSAAGWMYARGITDLYLAMALQYAHNLRYPIDTAVNRLYADAQACFKATGDEMHVAYCDFERADCATESVRSLGRKRWRMKRDAERLKRCIAQAEVDLGLCHTVAHKGEHFDYEIIAEAYDSLGDIRWLQDRREEAWGYYCAACVAGAAFLVQDQDNYSLHLYREVRNKLMARIREVAVETPNGEAGALKVCRFLYALWNGIGATEVRSFESVFLPLTDSQQTHLSAKFRRAILIERAETELLPPSPRLTDIEAESDDPSDSSSMRWMAAMRKQLADLADHGNDLISTEALDGCCLPEGFSGQDSFLSSLSEHMAAAD